MKINLHLFSGTVMLTLMACNAAPTVAPAPITSVPVPQPIVATTVVANPTATTGNPPINPATSTTTAAANPIPQNAVPATGELTMAGDRVRQIGRGTLKQVQLSPNGKILAAATSLGVQVYDAETLALQRVFSATVGALAVAFSPDGTLLAANDTTDTVSIYNVASGARTQSLIIGSEPVTTLAFLNDPKKLVVIQAGGKTEIWDVPSAKPSAKAFTLAHSEGLGLLLRAVFSADGKQMFVNSADNTLQAWDMERGSQYRTMKGHESPAVGMALSPDGKLLASASDDHTVRLWDAQSGAALKTFKGHDTTLEAVAFSRDGKILALGDTDRIIKLWDIASGNTLATITDTRFVKSLAFSADGTQLISANANALTLFDIKTSKASRSSDGFLEVPGNLVFSKDGSILAYSDEEIMVVWRNWGTNTPQKNVMRGHTKPIIAATISPDAQWLAALAVDGEGLLWNLKSLDKAPAAISGFTSGILSAAFSPDNTQLVIASLDDVQFWDVKTQKLLRKFPHLTQQISAVAFSPVAGRMAAATNDNKVQIVDLASQKLLRTLNGIAEPVYSVAYSADGLRIAAGSELGSVVVWNESSDDVIAKISGSGRTVLALAFSPDGSMLVTGETEGKIKLWQLPSGKPIREFSGHLNDIVELRFTSDSKQVASAGADGTVRFWDIR